MGAYEPPFSITNEILMYVSSISEKIGRITAIGNLDSKPHLRKNNRIKSIHSSLKIQQMLIQKLWDYIILQIGYIIFLKSKKPLNPNLLY